MRSIVLAPLLATAVASFAGAADDPPMVVRDADGNLVGTVLAQTVQLSTTLGLTDRFPLWVAQGGPGSWTFLIVGKNAVFTTKSLTPLLYESDYCSGSPLLAAPRTRDEVRQTVIFDTRIYLPVGPGSERTIRSQGVLLDDATKCEGVMRDATLCCTVVSQEEKRYASEASSVALATLNLRPPFHLEPAPPVK